MGLKEVKNIIFVMLNILKMTLNILYYRIDENLTNQINNFINSSCTTKIISQSAITIAELDTITAFENIDIILFDVSHDKLDIITYLQSNTVTLSKIIILSRDKDDVLEFVNYTIFDFLLFPIDTSKLLTTINRCINRIIIEHEKFKLKFSTEKFQKFIPINSTKKIELIKIDDIVYFEADGRYTLLYLTNGVSKMASKNLGEFISLLDPSVFCRIHHKFIINMNNLINIVKSDGYYCVMTNNKNIPVSKRKLENLNNLLNIGKNAI